MTHISCPLWRHFMRQYCISTSKYMPSCMSFKTQGQNRYVGSQTLHTVGYCAIQSFCLSTVMKKSHFTWELISFEINLQMYSKLMVYIVQSLLNSIHMFPSNTCQTYSLPACFHSQYGQQFPCHYSLHCGDVRCESYSSYCEYCLLFLYIQENNLIHCTFCEIVYNTVINSFVRVCSRSTVDSLHRNMNNKSIDYFKMYVFPIFWRT